MTAPLRTDKRDRSGCHGCLLAALIVILVTVVVLGVGYLAGRAYIVANLPLWREEYPWLALGLDVVGVLQEQPGEIIAPARVEGVDDPTLLPDGIAILPDPLIEVYSIGDGHVAVYQRTEEPLEAAVASMRAQKEAGGWQLTWEHEQADGLLLVWRREGWRCEADLVAEQQGGAELWLRCREGEAE